MTDFIERSSRHLGGPRDVSIMTRIAHCCCGSLRAEATREPAPVAACHCMECQRRSGSPLGVSTYFPKEQVR